MYFVQLIRENIWCAIRWEIHSTKSVWLKTLKVGEVYIEFKIDSVAGVNVLPLYILNSRKINFKPTKSNMEAYGGFKLNTVGEVVLSTSSKTSV